MIQKKDIVEMIINRINAVEKIASEKWENVGFHARFFYIDNLLDNKIVNKIYLNFPSHLNLELNKFNSFRERKKTFTKIDNVDPIIVAVTDAFHDKRVIKSIEKITKILNLKADPSLYAGGLSMMDKNDFLNPHIDNSHDSQKKFFRRLNLLYYISPNWLETYGGNLELWDHKVNRKITIHSKFNRLVVMNTNKTSVHSVSKVLVNKTRCCLSNYYFSENSPYNDDYYHITSFYGRPEEKFKRLYYKFDNFLRQQLANNFNVSRGKKYKRKKD
jgi:Rps23 Pro-64 3,4-dihydroxylase Tpa1-like proline 4-hydroxylase